MEQIQESEEINSETAELAVEVKDLRIAFRSYKERPTTLKESVVRFVKSGKLRYYETFDALKGISFNVKKGEIFGVIGSNGAGKSTLLKALTGVLPPASGSVKCHGTVDSLIQLGAGFDPELNAVENIYLYGSLRQKSQAEIKSHVPKILEFAELQEFASTPIKYYSSGMYARLGFAAAADIDPDVLIVDEVLAVGDERFREKCEKVFERFKREKKTIVIVSHSLGLMSTLPHRVAVLSKGEIVFVGDPKEAIEVYMGDDYKTALSA